MIVSERQAGVQKQVRACCTWDLLGQVGFVARALEIWVGDDVGKVLWAYVEGTSNAR